MLAKIHIRKAKLKDLSRISYITKIAYKSPFMEGGIITKPHQSDSLADDFKQNKIFIIVAEIDGKIVGSIRYKMIDNKTIYLFQLVVLKTFRGLMIGKKLIYKVEALAREGGLREITLDCMKEKNLHIYYQRLGYKIDSVKKVRDYHMLYLSKEI